MENGNYRIGELAYKAGVTRRTIRYYVVRGLLPAPEGTGLGTMYNDGHLYRLILIRKMQNDYLPLDEIRKRLDGMSERDIFSAAQCQLTENIWGITQKEMSVCPDVEEQDCLSKCVRYDVSDVTIDASEPAGIKEEMEVKCAAEKIEISEVGSTTGLAAVAAAELAGMPRVVPCAAPCDVSDEIQPMESERILYSKIRLGYDVELHFPANTGRNAQRMIERIVELSKQVMKEG